MHRPGSQKRLGSIARVLEALSSEDERLGTNNLRVRQSVEGGQRMTSRTRWRRNAEMEEEEDEELTVTAYQHWTYRGESITLSGKRNQIRLL